MKDSVDNNRTIVRRYFMLGGMMMMMIYILNSLSDILDSLWMNLYDDRQTNDNNINVRLLRWGNINMAKMILVISFISTLGLLVTQHMG